MYVIGIKKKLYGSENEVELRYAAMESGTKPVWAKLGSAIQFNSVSDAREWWKRYCGPLLSDRNVLKNTVSVLRIHVDTECTLPSDYISEQDKLILDMCLSTIVDEMKTAHGILGQEGFNTKFAPKVIGAINDFKGNPLYKNPFEKPKRSVNETKEELENVPDENPGDFLSFLNNLMQAVGQNN